MAASATDSLKKTSAFTQVYPQLVKPGTKLAPIPEDHISTAPNFGASPKARATTVDALARNAEIVKNHVGAGRNANRYILAGSAALGLAVACGGHPWAGVAIAAVGALVGFGVQAYMRHRALKSVCANGMKVEDFKNDFESFVRANDGVVNDPQLRSARQMHAFLTRTMWGDVKRDVVKPAKTAVKLVGVTLRKAFAGKNQAAEGAGEQLPAQPAVA